MAVHVTDSIFFKDLYGTPEMRAVFDDLNLLQKWLDYEAALARAEASLGLVPPEAATEITRKARAELMDTDAIKRGVDETVHPLVALIWQLSERCENEAGRYVHWGATTQDVMDTALILQIKEALPLLESGLEAVTRAAAVQAKTHRDTLMAGRTHGQQALPITFGFKVAVWVAELERHRLRLDECKPRILTGEFAGASGTLASVSANGLEINARLMQELGLKVPLIAWHTARDHIAEFTNILTMICATVGKIAHEIIDLQKQEFGEVEEPFEMGKIGSSTMPQKRNPMICEAILAIARLARTRASTAVDAMFHEHERDWSSFQMEWAYLPELCVMTHGALAMTQRVLEGLIVYPANMLRNLSVTRGSLLGERVMLALGKFIGRQHAHDIIYEAAMESFEQQTDFAAVLKRHPSVTAHLSAETIDSLLDPAQYTGLSGVFVDRVLESLKRT
ncbi:MAG TPA: adenylosuccinate lyase [Aggregatilineales bacterium]|nr:adenylosuccinate lyase [Aggregatilineales bacterium]